MLEALVHHVPAPLLTSTPCSIAIVSSSAEGANAIMHRARPCLWGKSPTSCGAPTTKVSSCWAIKNTVTRTVTDHASRYLLLCEALESTCEALAFTAFQRLFQERGLPGSMRSDNGVPFASPNSLFNLSKLSVWWLRLGITIERIQPGHPQQNGRHERMHLTLKTETTRPAGMHSLQQQSKFDDFLEEFNNECPHEALDMKCPAEVYTPALRRYRGLPELAYPFHDQTIHVTNCGRICLHRKKINLSTVFAGQAVGIKEVEEGMWLVSFMDYDLGYIDLEEKTLQPLNNPFGPKV